MDKITSQISAQEKAMSEKISKQITDSQKSIQEKLTAQEKGTKDLSDKIGKLRKICFSCHELIRYSQAGEV